MITSFSHSVVYVLDQDSAYDFYVNKLGLVVREDAKFGEGYRWLTVSPENQPNFEISLLQISESPMMSADQADSLRRLVTTGTLSVGVFITSDVKSTYEALLAKGVEFTQAPEQRPYGIESVAKDDSGNWFCIVQRP